MSNTPEANAKMFDNKKKKFRKVFISIITTIILVCIAGYTFVNRGVSVEIANNIDIGMDIVISSPDGDLRGSLFINEQGKSPAVIMIVGSSATSYRRSWQSDVYGIWKPITELLHRHGYAVLLLEKRGINGSSGHWEHQSFKDRAEDVKTAIDYLKTREDIDSSRIGLMGHSQGGWIVQLFASIYPHDVAYIVNMAGPSTTVMEQVLDDYEGEYIIAGLSSDEIEQKMKWHKWLLNFVYNTAPILKFGNISHIIRYDAEAIRNNINVPVFSIYAENDRLVLPEKNIDLLIQGLESAGNKTYEIYTVSGVNHGFKPAEFSTPNEQLTNTAVSDDFLDVIELFVLWEKDLTRAN